LNQKLNVPIGLLVSAVGGTPAQAWMSPTALLSREDMRYGTLQAQRWFAERSKGTLAEQMTTWWQVNDTGTKNHWYVPALDDAAWKNVKVPGPWQKTEIGNFHGVVWFRKQVEVPAAWAGKDVILRLGSVGDRDTTFFNGEAVGDMNLYLFYQPRVYKIPGKLVQAGNITIAVGVLDTGTGYIKGGLMGAEDRHDIDLSLTEDAEQKIDLAGDWKYQMGPSLADVPPPPPNTPDILKDTKQTTVLSNGMIAPLAPFAVRGVIWYQGESDATHAAQYQTLFPDLIRDWRRIWNAKEDGSDFSFYFVQLPNFIPPAGQDWAAMREAQAMALKLPHTGMITTIDIGSADSIHPGDKQNVGKRLALLALAIYYGQKTEYSGPVFHTRNIAYNKVTVVFSNADGLKTVDAAPPMSFSVAGDDKQWHVASARLEGTNVVVWSDQVPSPKAVRYAYENNPKVNLVNAAGLPAVPFQTSHIP
jgi:sialate O-acetylesterase